MYRINFSNRLIIIISAIITLLTAILSTLLIPKPEKYRIELVKESSMNGADMVTYSDLDNNGVSEKISFNWKHGGTLSILAVGKGQILFHNRYDGRFLPWNFYFFADYNNDHKNEIYFFRCVSDTLVLDIIEPCPETQILSNFPIVPVHKINGVIDFNISGFALDDIDSDGYKELFFSLNCGYSFKNRYIFHLNIKNKQLLTTPKTGIPITGSFTLCDIDSDKRKEIFGKYGPFGNTEPDYPWSDQFCWLMVYSDSLKFKFNPFITGKYPGEITTLPYFTGKDHLISVFQNDGGKNDSTFIGLYSPDGSLIRYRKLQYPEELQSTYFYTYPFGQYNKIALLTTDGTVQEFDSSLNIIATKQIPQNLYPINQDMDIDSDSQLERFFIDDSYTRIYITRNDFSNPTMLDLKYPLKELHISLKKGRNKKSVIAISTADKYFEAIYFFSNYYKYRYIIRIALALSVFLFFYAIGKLYYNQLKKRYDSEKSIANLQLKALEGNQLNPHFTLNIINSIGALYEKSDIANAQYYFGKYTKLLRQSLIWSGQISNSLVNEIDFAKNYLELEKLRLNGNFEFYIDDTAIPDIQIPKFLIHTFAENAIKHGISPIMGIRDGILSIRIIDTPPVCQIVITDNGVGIQNSQETSAQSTGKGFLMLDEILMLYKKITNRKVTYQLKSLDSAGSGTHVEINIYKN